MWPIYLYPLFFSIIFFKYYRKSGFSMYSIVLALYAFAGFSSVYLVCEVDNFKLLHISGLATVYHIFLLYVLIAPLKEFDRRVGEQLYTTKSSIMRPFTLLIIFLMSIYIYDGIKDVNITSILEDVHDVRAGISEANFYESGGILGYIAYVAKGYTVVPIALMFYYIIHEPHRKKLIYILLFCSMGTMLVELRVAAREYLIKYLFVFLMAVIMLWGKINANWQTRIRRILLVGGALVILVFLLITILRFEDTDSGVFVSLLSYLGQGYAYFSEGFLEWPDGMFPEKGTLCFPFFSSSTRSNYNMADQVVTNIHLNVFRTSIGSWTADCGVYLTVLISVIFSYIYRTVAKQKKFTIFTIIYILMIYELTFSQLFFFNSQITGTKLLTVFILIFLDQISRRVYI